MRKLTIAALILTLVAPSVSLAAFTWSEERLQLTMGGYRARGFRGGQRKRFGAGKRGHGFRRGDRTNRFYYYHPRYFYRNYRELRRFYRHQNGSYYPNQGGFDYRGWFDFPRR